jgi:murein DD-endopeptidase MepM/ murein hydrolase activator NlpD
VISRRTFWGGACVLPVISAAARAIPRPPFTVAGSREQGSLVVGKLAKRAEVALDGKPLTVSPEGYFAFGLEYNQTAPAKLLVTVNGGAPVTSELVPVTRKYEMQRINGLPEQEAHPSEPAIIARIARENGMIVEARKRDTSGTAFAEPFDWPVAGIISGLFGSQRILNGQPSTPHFGIDIAAPEGTPIRAPADGTVSLAEPDFYLTGGTTVLDHGHGVFTIYIHQSALKVVVGQAVKRRDIIGLVGMKGRATGPHLHWGMNWFQMKLDPSLSTRTPVPAKA